MFKLLNKLIDQLMKNISEQDLTKFGTKKLCRSYNKPQKLEKKK